LLTDFADIGGAWGRAAVTFARPELLDPRVLLGCAVPARRNIHAELLTPARADTWFGAWNLLQGIRC
jgi:hypothetical protein